MVKTLVIMIFYCQNLKRQAVIIKYYFLKNFLLKKHVQKHVILRRKLCIYDLVLNCSISIFNFPFWRT